LRKAGFVIKDIPGYAPEAAWLEAESGHPKDALRNISKLRAMKNVVQVEPELIRPVSRR
jgi:hypothetical protein